MINIVSISSSSGSVGIKVICECHHTFITTNRFYTECPYCHKRRFIGALKFKNVDLSTIL